LADSLVPCLRCGDKFSPRARTCPKGKEPDVQRLREENRSLAVSWLLVAVAAVWSVLL
jgi:hypothetical protein